MCPHFHPHLGAGSPACDLGQGCKYALPLETVVDAVVNSQQGFRWHGAAAHRTHPQYSLDARFSVHQLCCGQAQRSMGA
jgi:hypothetical protein